jgi:DNA polymerase III delta subunit
VSAETLLPIYLLTGSDAPKVRLALRRLRARFPAETVELRSAEKTSGADAVAACNALGLFGGESGTLVIVEGVETWQAADADAFAEYLANPAPGAVIALVAETVPKGSKLAELCAKSGDVLVFDAPKPKDLPAWVRGHFERLGKPVDGEVAKAVVEAVGGDRPDVLEREIEKLVTWAGPEPIRREDVEALAVSAHEAPPWDLTDAWAASDPKRLLSACERSLAEGKEPFVVALGLTSHIRFVNDVEALAGEGLSAKEIAKRTRKHEFRVRKALADAEKHPREERHDAVLRLAELDAALKGSSRLAGELELELALGALLSSAEPGRRHRAASPAGGAR